MPVKACTYKAFLTNIFHIAYLKCEKKKLTKIDASIVYSMKMDTRSGLFNDGSFVCDLKTDNYRLWNGNDKDLKRRKRRKFAA